MLMLALHILLCLYPHPDAVHDFVSRCAALPLKACGNPSTPAGLLWLIQMYGADACTWSFACMSCILTGSSRSYLPSRLAADEASKAADLAGQLAQSQRALSEAAAEREALQVECDNLHTAVSCSEPALASCPCYLARALRQSLDASPDGSFIAFEAGTGGEGLLCLVLA